MDVIEPEVLFALQAGRHPGGRRPAVDAERAGDQDPGRDRAAGHRLHDGGRGLRGAVPADAAGHARERVRGPGLQGAVRPRLRARGGRERDLRRARQPAPARLLRPRAAARRPGLLRHPAQLPGLPHLLLPDVLRGQRLARPDGRLQALPRPARPGHRRCPAGRNHGRGGGGLAARPGVRIRRRGGRVCAAVRARGGAVDLGEADHQPAGLARPPGDRSSRAWCSRWRRSGRQPTAGRRPASRSSWSSPPTAAR